VFIGVEVEVVAEGVCSVELFGTLDAIV